MARTLTVFVTLTVSVTALCSILSSASTATRDLETLLRRKQYVELRRNINLDLSWEDAAFFGGIVANRKNRVEESIKLLMLLMPKLAARPPSWREKELLKTLADDYSKNFEYAKSAETFSVLLKRYGKVLSREEHRIASNRRDEMHLLRSAPRQTVQLTAPSKLPAARDILGLLEIPVEANGKTESWVLDTGANTSMITESTARRIGLQLLEGSATTGDVTGLPVSFRVGVLPQLTIGNAVFHNVELPVASDHAFNIAGYQIQGIIGFPVQSALGRITIYADGHVGINSEPPEQPGSEMFMEDQMPIVVVKAAGAERLFSIDTGAMTSTFGPHFYRAVKSQLTEKMRTKTDMVGAGGTRHLRSYKMTDLAVGLGGQEVKLASVTILTEPRGRSDVFFGALGQDVFRSFNSFTIDFQNMTLTARQ